MIGERTRRLLVVFGLALAALVARLGWLQLVEHEIWAEEATRLVHSGQVVPYTRGRILTADGEVLARDVRAYRLTFAYRPFRRHHPLGQVTHARSALEARAVALSEARRHLEPWALELVHLTPAELSDFGRGGALTTASLSIPATPDPRAEARSRRAADLGFYLRGLLGVDAKDWRTMGDLGEARPEADYLDLCALAQGRPRDLIEDELVDRWSESIGHLRFLATQIGFYDLETLTAEQSLEYLIEFLEESRQAVENAVAGALFEEATGLAAGRVDPDCLARTVDLEGIRSLLRWDAGDLADWTRSARVRWTSGWRDGYVLPRLVAELTLHPEAPRDADRVISTLAACFASEEALEAALDGRPIDWRELEGVAALEALDGLFVSELAPVEARPVLPWLDPQLRSLVLEGEETWRLLDLVDPGENPSAAWRANLSARGASAREERYRLALGLVERWEAQVQGALAARLEATLARAAPEELGPTGGLVLARGRLDRAEERAAYILRDYGGRGRQVHSEPSYDVVYLLTRYADRYPGFVARESRRRERVVLPGDPWPLAEHLIGGVSRADVLAMQAQRAAEQRLAELRRQPQRTVEEKLEFVSLLEAVLLPEEISGVSGIEGYCDRELRGTNGYEERLGLDDLAGNTQALKTRIAPEDGRDVTLTLHADLQRAAERVINDPTPPIHDAQYDPYWYRRPTGAIVLITPDGDVLAAASAPLDPAGGALPPVLERTLNRPTFQPPGSTFKMFVALWALEQGLDPARTVNCTVMADGRCGYVDVRCWYSTGHGAMDLAMGLTKSCNAYFAWLGESLSTDDFRGVARTFGFGEPTGVRTPPLADGGARKRHGLREIVNDYVFDADLNDSARRRAGNGLGRIEATPMQIARATAGLATGVLPSLRMVQRVGDEAAQRGPSRRIDASEANLRRIRRALFDVTQHENGTAYDHLNAEVLGFVLPAKTGSADVVSRSRSDATGRVRKHTWVAGWAPYEEPEFVVLVFVHDTSATSSHSAVYVAQEFLLQQEVRDWMESRGMDLESPR